MVWNFLFKLFRFSASVELAVFLILAVAIALSAGTIYESKYSAAIASQLVYRSWWMQILLWLFVVNLAAAAFSRWPWKRQHIGFLITHLGLIILLLGGWVTQRAGIDGTLALGVGEKGRTVSLDQNMLYVFKNIPGRAYDLILSKPLNFDLRYVSEKVSTYALNEVEGLKEIRVLRYYPKSLRSVSAVDVESGGVPALKVSLNGSRANMQDWLFLQKDVGTTRELGPATIKFLPHKPKLSVVADKATLLIYLDESDSPSPFLAVASKGEKFKELGRIQRQKPIALGWMDFTFTLQEFHKQAIPKAEYEPYIGNSPKFEGSQAIEVELGKEKLWIELGTAAQVSANNSIYYIQFAKNQIDLGFDLMLNKFQIGYYEGTTRAKSYSSEVSADGAQHIISMNEPLDYKGFTFYQASYDMDELGQPRASIFSVNYDPGRWIKYFGSIMLVLGVISMFYFKPQYSGTSKWLKKKGV